jgi:hypothetical protein
MVWTSTIGLKMVISAPTPATMAQVRQGNRFRRAPRVGMLEVARFG